MLDDLEDFLAVDNDINRITSGFEEGGKSVRGVELEMEEEEGTVLDDVELPPTNNNNQLVQSMMEDSTETTSTTTNLTNKEGMQEQL